MAEVEFTLPNNHTVFILTDERLRKIARRFGWRYPSEVIRGILLGRLKPLRLENEGCLVRSENGCGAPTVFNAPEEEAQELIRAIEEWPEKYGLTFGDFLFNVALGHYDIVEAPRRQEHHKSNGHARPRCRVCGRPLTSPEAIAKGIGPVCEAKINQTRAA